MDAIDGEVGAGIVELVVNEKNIDVGVGSPGIRKSRAKKKNCANILILSLNLIDDLSNFFIHNHII